MRTGILRSELGSYPILDLETTMQTLPPAPVVQLTDQQNTTLMNLYTELQELRKENEEQKKINTELRKLLPNTSNDPSLEY